MEFYFTKGSKDQLCRQNIQIVARDVLQVKLVFGNLYFLKKVILDHFIARFFIHKNFADWPADRYFS